MAVSKDEFKEAIRQGGNPEGPYDISTEDREAALSELAEENDKLSPGTGATSAKPADASPPDAPSPRAPSRPRQKR